MALGAEDDAASVEVRGVVEKSLVEVRTRYEALKPRWERQRTAIGAFRAARARILELRAERDKSASLGETAKARLSIMRETEDGFRIAEEDLKLRGAGEMLGTRQSGLPLFRMADLSADGDLLAAARDDAQLILNKDHKLTTGRGEALRILLYLFERDEAIRLLSAG